MPKAANTFAKAIPQQSGVSSGNRIGSVHDRLADEILELAFDADLRGFVVAKSGEVGRPKKMVTVWDLEGPIGSLPSLRPNAADRADIALAQRVTSPGRPPAPRPP